MIHEIGEGRFSPEYKNISACEDSHAMSIRGPKVLVKVSCGEMMIPTFNDYKELFPASYDTAIDNAYYLFAIDDEPYFSAEISEEEMDSIIEYESVEECLADIDAKKLDSAFFYMSIYKLRDLHPIEMIFAAATGVHIMSWKRSRAYCGVCGTKAIPSETERAMICPKCHSMEFPKICPAIIVAIKNKEGKLLLIRNKLGNYHHLALVSGFMEIGESFEDTIRREVFEEVGLKIKNLKFYSSQPWGMSLSLMIGYTAEVDGDDTITIQESELSEGGWYTREETPNHPYELSIGNEMLHKFKIGEI